MVIKVWRKDYLRTMVKRYPMYGHEYFISSQKGQMEFTCLNDKEHNMSLTWCTNVPGIHYELDYSNNREFLYIVEGTLTVEDVRSGKTFTAFPGDMIMYHSLVHTHSRTNRTLWATTLRYKPKWGDERYFIPVPTAEDSTEA